MTKKKAEINVEHIFTFNLDMNTLHFHFFSLSNEICEFYCKQMGPWGAIRRQTLSVNQAVTVGGSWK